MLDVIEVIKEKYIEEGKKEGEKLGEIKSSREMLETALGEVFEFVPAYIIDKVRTINHQGVLNNLFKQAIRCRELSKFESLLNQATAVA